MNSRDARIIMTKGLNAISEERQATAGFIAKSLLNNFTSREIGVIANTIQEGKGNRLLELIKG